MLKLLICLIVFTAVAVGLVDLRQRRLDLAHDASRLHAALEVSQAKLWDQQLRIAALTGPSAVARSADAHHLALTANRPALADVQGD